MPDQTTTEINVLGQTNFRGQFRSFGIYPDDRRRHVYVIGKTGVGKSTLLENMIAQDIAQGKGVCYVDPHGDTVERLLDAIPPNRINDVVYFNPADVDFPVAFNVLEAIDPAYKYLIASGLVSSLKKMWADSWGPRLEYILRNTILALLDYPSSTILGILRMLADKDYRKKVVSHVSDPVVKAFWTTEFANYNERFRTEAISPIQNKVGQLLSSSIIRNIMAQPKSTIDMKDIMDNGKILLVNVSKGRIGEDNSALLGAMMINRIQLAAMDRANMDEDDRRDFYLYVDEFQNFATESFADILSEARKYRLNLTIAHQYIAQMEEEVRDAVFGNVGTIVSFRVGAADAELLEQEFAPVFTQTDLVNIDKYNAFIKLMINGIASKPFSMRTLAPVLEHYGKAEVVRLVSRERYGHKRSLVEEKIARWSGVTLGEKAQIEAKDGKEDQKKIDQKRTQHLTTKAIEKADELEDVIIEAKDQITDLASALKPQGNRDNTSSTGSKKIKQSWPVVCQRCGKNTDVPFEPDPDKPVYCKECFDIVRQEKRAQKDRQKSEPEPKPQRKQEQPKQQAPTTKKTSGGFRGPQPPPLP